MHLPVSSRCEKSLPTMGLTAQTPSRRLLRLLAMLVVAAMAITGLAATTPAQAQTAVAPTAGDGSPASPYQIATWENLYWFSQNPGQWDRSYIQTANIAFPADITAWDSGAGWSPIGNGTTAFSGSYDGQGFSISGLFINRGSENPVGFFGSAVDASVSNLTLSNARVTASHEVGVMFGRTAGTTTATNCHVSGEVESIRDGANAADAGGFVGFAFDIEVSQSSASVDVTARGRNVGGFVGDARRGTYALSFATGNATSSENGQVGGFAGLCRTDSISNSFALGRVQQASGASQGAGGFIGRLIDNALVTPTISNSYSIGAASGGTTGVGGFVGSYVAGNISDSYWDTDVSGLAVSGDPGASGQTTPNMKNQATFSGWDFAATWVMSSQLTYDGYPALGYSGAIAQSPAGNEIATLSHLVWLAEDASRWSGAYTQTADINAVFVAGWDGEASSGTPYSAQGFSAIGNVTTAFTGSYDGGGFTIGNLMIDRPTTDNVGLFGFANGMTIENVILHGATLTGADNVGALVGHIDSGDIASGSGAITNIQVEDVSIHAGAGATASSASGGLLGRVRSANLLVENVSTSGRVEGRQRVGGIIGSLRGNSTIFRFGASSAEVLGIASDSRFLGGALGVTEGGNPLTEFVYSTGRVDLSMANTLGNGDVGGFVGLTSSDAVVRDSYATGDVLGPSATTDSRGIGGFAGRILSNSAISTVYSTGAVSSAAGSVGGFAGGFGSSVAVSDAYWNMQTSGQPASASDAVGRTSAQMQDITNYPGWNIIGTTSTVYQGQPFPGFDLGDPGAATWILTDAGYSITYDANGATAGTAPADQTKTHNVDLTLAGNTGSLVKTGHTFNGWNTQADGAGTPYAAGADYTANSAVTLFADWTINQYSVTLSAAPSSGGSVSGAGSFDFDQSVTVEATPATGYSFVNWTESATAVSSDANYTFNMPDNARTLVANFSPNSYTVSTTASNGSITSPVNPVIDHGSTTTVTGQADTNHFFSAVSGCGGVAQANSDQAITTFSYTTGPITADCTVQAQFAIRTYVLSYSAGVNGSIIGDASQTVDHGASGTPVTADPDADFGFLQWSDGLSDNPRTDSNVTADVAVSAEFGALRSIGGTVSALAANGLELQLNGGGTLAVGANGEFLFGPRLPEGASYEVTVSQQPNQQVCSVTSLGAGPVGGADILDVAVECVTDPGATTYRLGGDVDGLAGSGLELRNNGGDLLAITANGAFVFAPEYVAGSSYAVTVAQQPVGQNCAIVDANGVLNDDVSSLQVTCATDPGVDAFTVGGSVNGLQSGSVELTLNQGYASRTLSAEQAFTFSEALTEGSSYRVEVTAQPAGQLCVVNNGQGVLGAGNVNDVEVNCQTSAGFYLVSASVGANGELLGDAVQVIAENASADFELAADPGFTPATPTGDCPVGSFAGDIYTTGPIGSDCSIAFAFDANQYVLSFDAQGGTVSPNSATVTFGSPLGALPVPTRAGNTFAGWNTQPDGSGATWTGATTYQVVGDSTVFAQWTLNQHSVIVSANPSTGGSVSGGGTFDFAESVAVTATPQATYSFVNWTEGGVEVSADSTYTFVMPDNARELVANFSLNTFTVGGSVSGLEGSGLVLQNNGGDDLAVSADGSFTFATALADGSGYDVTVLSQPASPSQTCSVSNGNGTLAGADVTNVQISCATQDVALSSDNLAFGAIRLGDEGQSSVTISNFGAADVTLTALQGPQAPFSVVGGTCLDLPTTLAAGESCTLIVGFSTMVPGGYSGSLAIENDAGEPLMVALSASVAPAVIPVLSKSGLILLVLLMGLVALVSMRRMA